MWWRVHTSDPHRGRKRVLSVHWRHLHSPERMFPWCQHLCCSFQSGLCDLPRLPHSSISWPFFSLATLDSFKTRSAALCLTGPGSLWNSAAHLFGMLLPRHPQGHGWELGERGNNITWPKQTAGVYRQRTLGHTSNDLIEYMLSPQMIHSPLVGKHVWNDSVLQAQGIQSERRLHPSCPTYSRKLAPECWNQISSLALPCLSMVSPLCFRLFSALVHFLKREDRTAERVEWETGVGD